jgi:3'-phosphoadenosine 5'-phosphosulfate sulfotransferase (PAPS reductase)/FAD synthetase
MNKRSLYYINEHDQTCISFSGGRTSAYMLYKILEAHDGKLPKNAIVTFANTGKEMPETLDFVRDVGMNWGVDIVWLERFAREAVGDEKVGRTKYMYETKVVTYETASRKGEPFEALIKARRYAPNPVARFCTSDLKIRAIKEYLMDECGFETPYTAFIGIRGDEQRRAAKMNGTIESGQERYLPLWIDGVTAKDVGKFWDESDFDLGLPNNNGVTDWGNCDLCFLKGTSKRQSIIREQPQLADWWIDQESKLSTAVGKAAFFRKDAPSYQAMKDLAVDQNNIFDNLDIDESIPCFCGE